MYYIIDKINELESKGKKKIYGFNVLVVDSRDSNMGIGIPGFRVMNGAIYPPAGRKGTKWYPSLYMTLPATEVFYQDVKQAFEEKGINVLLDQETAIDPLINNKAFCMFFPTVTGNFEKKDRDERYEPLNIQGKTNEQE